MPKASLQDRKQQFVRDAIFDAAVETFAIKGFDETTVEDVARAAGVSRATFFRYFASKDDLLAQNVMKYGAALTEAIKACPRSFSPFEMMRHTLVSVAQQTGSHPRTRQVMEISLRSASATQAHASRLIEVEQNVAIAFAERIGDVSKNDLEPRLLAAMTVSTMNVGMMSWYQGEHEGLPAAVEQAISRLARIVSDQTVRKHSHGKGPFKAPTKVGAKNLRAHSEAAAHSD